MSVAIEPAVESGLLRGRDVIMISSLDWGSLWQSHHDIASRLASSPRTVETHVSSIISKLGARSRTEAVRKAVQGSLIR